MGAGQVRFREGEDGVRQVVLRQLPTPQSPAFQVAHPALKAPVLPVRQGSIQADAEDFIATALCGPAQADLVAEGAGEGAKTMSSATEKPTPNNRILDQTSGNPVPGLIPRALDDLTRALYRPSARRTMIAVGPMMEARKVAIPTVERPSMDTLHYECVIGLFPGQQRRTSRVLPVRAHSIALLGALAKYYTESLILVEHISLLEAPLMTETGSEVWAVFRCCQD